MLQVQLDFSVTSLFGKVGAAEVPFCISKYNINTSSLWLETKVEDKCAERLW